MACAGHNNGLKINRVYKVERIRLDYTWTVTATNEEVVFTVDHLRPHQLAFRKRSNEDHNYKRDSYQSWSLELSGVKFDGRKRKHLYKS